MAADVATVPEIPYYLQKLKETDLESKRIEYNKIIHDAIVNADVTDKKTVKKLDPIIDQVRIAMDSGLDRPYIAGQIMWLNSAVEYYEMEKNRPLVDIPPSDWLASQSEAHNGTKISTFPERILLMEEGKEAKTLAEYSNIHEAVISPDAKRVVFFRRTGQTTQSEIFVVDLRRRKPKKIATVPSCNSLLLSLDGDAIIFKEVPKQEGEPAAVMRLSVGGGKPKQIGKAASLETVVAKGDHKGALIVYEPSLYHLGLSRECPFAWTLSGKVIGRIKNTACRD